VTTKTMMAQKAQMRAKISLKIFMCCNYVRDQFMSTTFKCQRPFYVSDQLIGSIPFAARYSLVLEKWRHPKNPVFAE